MLHWRTMMVTVFSGGCLVTAPTSFVSEAPVTPPRILDLQGVTRPRLSNLIILTEESAGLQFEVPVEDVNVDDPLQYQFFLNNNRDCVSIEGSEPCGLGVFVNTLGPTGSTVRGVRANFLIDRFRPGCNRVELWVSSSFRLDGNFHTPVRAGDVDFAAWWVFVRPRAGSEGDGGVVDPVERCGFLVQP